ncbi:hypothetical protein [Streptomyces sp. NBC_01538]|uniref:hypothetical protein n=1 Tax=Streptomyces sp. NBC_01538 TaxID=2903897 RepID=UPI0038668FEB
MHGEVPSPTGAVDLLVDVPAFHARWGRSQDFAIDAVQLIGEVGSVSEQLGQALLPMGDQRLLAQVALLIVGVHCLPSELFEFALD